VVWDVSSYAAALPDNLTDETRVHVAEPSHLPWKRGLDYRGADVVMIDADIYGWATRAGSLSELDRSRLVQAADELERSIVACPPDAQPYDERLLRIARLTLAV
jgi:hypothetical protein